MSASKRPSCCPRHRLGSSPIASFPATTMNASRRRQRSTSSGSHLVPTLLMLPLASWAPVVACAAAGCGARLSCRRPRAEVTPRHSTAARSSSSERWRLQQLLDASDVVPRPGPPRKRPAPSLDLIQADVLPSTAVRYSAALFEFERFLAVRDIPGALPKLACFASSTGLCAASELLSTVAFCPPVRWVHSVRLPHPCSRRRPARSHVAFLCPFGGFTDPGSSLFQAPSGYLWHTTTCLPWR